MLYPVCATLAVKAQIKSLMKVYSHGTDAKTYGTALIHELPWPKHCQCKI